VSASAQNGRRGKAGVAQPAAAKPVPEIGIPVIDPLVIARCGGCHKQDEKGNLTRISWERTNPKAGRKRSSAWCG